MKTPRLLALAAAAAALVLGAAAGCDDDDGGKPTVADGGSDAARTDGPGTTAPDGGSPDAGVTPPLPDGGPGADGGTAAIKLTDWVHDLVTNHTNISSAADTVEDKNIVDTTDPNAFDSLLQ